MGRIVNPWMLLAALALLAGASGWGYRAGGAACEARHAARLEQARKAAATAAEIASRKEADRLAAEAERDALARELEDEARNDPGAGGCGLGADSLRRLNRL